MYLEPVSQGAAVATCPPPPPLLAVQGVSHRYGAKPVLRDVAHCCLDHTGLDGILDVFGPGGE